MLPQLEQIGEIVKSMSRTSQEGLRGRTTAAERLLCETTPSTVLVHITRHTIERGEVGGESGPYIVNRLCIAD